MGGLGRGGGAQGNYGTQVHNQGGNQQFAGRSMGGPVPGTPGFNAGAPIFQPAAYGGGQQPQPALGQLLVPVPAVAPTANVGNTEHTASQLVAIGAVDNHHKDDSLPLVPSMHKRGLRVDAPTVQAHATVKTNFLSIQRRPASIFVYKLEFVKEYDKSDPSEPPHPIYIKNKFDKEGLFSALKPRIPQFQTKTNWTTDFDNIWSTAPLFHDLDFTQVPAAITNLRGTSTNSLQPVDAQVASILFDRVIDIQRTIGQLYSGATGRLDGNDDSILLTRGLNSMVTTYARDTARNVAPSGANKFYNTTRTHELSTVIRAIHGFFFSVRPGSQQLWLNVNLRCSPFFQDNLDLEVVIRDYC